MATPKNTGLGGENRTPTYGFGDRSSAIKLHRDTGAGSRTRTDDIFLGKEAFYQLNYTRYATKLLNLSAA